MFDIGLNLALGASPVRWWPANADYAADFVHRRYMRAGLPAAVATAFSFARGSSKWVVNSTGTWQMAAAGVPTMTDRGLVLEPAETYYPTNSLMSGAAVGVVGSGGALPTGWESSSWTEIEVVSITDEGEFKVITLDLTFDNTGGGSAAGRGVRLCDIPAVQGEFWTMGLFGESAALGDDTCTAPDNIMQVQERDAGNGFLNNDYGVLLNFDSGDLGTRQSVTKEITDATTARVQNFYSWNNILAGEYFHRRISLKMPTATRSQTVTSPMPTTDSGTVTRAADAMTLHLPAGAHRLVLTLAGGGEQTVTGTGGDVELSNAAAQAISSVVATPS